MNTYVVVLYAKGVDFIRDPQAGTDFREALEKSTALYNRDAMKKTGVDRADVILYTTKGPVMQSFKVVYTKTKFKFVEAAT